MEQLRLLPELFHEMDKKLDRLLEIKPCPNPGMCLELDEKVTSLETTRAETKGGWKVIVAISGLIGGLVGWIINHFTSKHP
jgi:hypothetical protein